MAKSDPQDLFPTPQPNQKIGLPNRPIRLWLQAMQKQGKIPAGGRLVFHPKP